ncbi:MAG: hypothetical protein ACO1OF_06525 [Adhaeribacter sp.]
MNKLINIIVLVFVTFLSSCSEEEGRIEFMQEELGLIIPSDYKQLENSTDGYIDFEVNIELRFSESAFKQLTSQVQKTKSYNHPELKSGGYSLPPFIKQNSSLPGVWIRSKKGFEFVQNRDEPEAEPVWATIDTSKRILKFNFVHL